LNVTKGYAVHAQGSGVRTFHGRLNTGNIVTNPALTRTVNLGWGWNLVGNPYASPIDLNSAGITWTNVDFKVYFLDQAAGNYKVWPAGSTPPIVPFGTGTGYPLSMQGFFVHVTSTQSSGSITFTNAARTFTSDHVFYKNSVPDLLRLKVEESTGMNDEIIICFNPETTVNYDEASDFTKLYGDPEAPQLYSVTPENSQLTVNTLPFSGINTVVPLEFSVEKNGAGNYSITASDVESFRSGTTITLEDKKTNTSQVLTENPIYNFSYAQGDDPARFLLRFHNPYFGIDEKDASQQVMIYSNASNLYVKDLAGKDLKGQLVVYNLVGQRITAMPLNGGALNTFSMSLEQGYYIVEVVTDGNSYHGKVYLTR
jgi:hypothetical protein